MYINALTIKNFGIYKSVELSNLPSGIAVFLGENEAGKSTCLAFLRSMLTGFPQGRASLLRPGPETMGSLSLVLRNGDRLRITRQREKNREKCLLLRDGSELPAHVFNDLFAGVSREMYTRVFGFSLGELEKALALEDLQDALASATFGAGLREPALPRRIGQVYFSCFSGQLMLDSIRSMW